MDFMSLAVQFGLVIFAIVAAFFGIVVGLPVWLHHRRTVLKMKAGTSRDVEALHRRIDGLEKQCRKLQDQVTEAHVMLADERRELDRRLERKLADIVPDPSVIPNAPGETARSESRKRVPD